MKKVKMMRNGQLQLIKALMSNEEDRSVSLVMLTISLNDCSLYTLSFIKHKIKHLFILFTT